MSTKKTHYNSSDDSDRYASYEEQFDPIKLDRQARRKRKTKVRHMPKVSQMELLNEMSDETINLNVEGGFRVTYKPSLYEEGWLINSLRSFFEQDLISDVLALVKGGKEASVYRCAATASTGEEFLAAKVYRPRQFRSLSNDSLYREGRYLLSSKGEFIDNSDQRTMRAVGKKSAFGKQVSHTSWLMYEYSTLQRLYELGASVPRPVEVNENTILMTYHGDEYMPAATLNKVSLPREEAQPLFEEVLRNIDLMLQNNMIHGDLSAYNILYWDGEITLIDFPQVSNSRTNGNAEMILRRDIERVCDYFNRQGLKTNAEAIFQDFWDRYIADSPENFMADTWREEIDDDDEDDDFDYDEDDN